MEFSFEGQERIVDKSDIVLLPVTNDRESKVR